MPTSAKEWKRTEEMTLPSGNVVRVKRVSLMDLIVQGGIPDTLSPLATEVATKTQMKLEPGDLQQYEAVVNLVVKAAVVEPQVADQAGPETLGVREIDWLDRLEIFKWANGVATTLRPFRGERPPRPFPAS